MVDGYGCGTQCMTEWMRVGTKISYIDIRRFNGIVLQRTSLSISSRRI